MDDFKAKLQAVINIINEMDDMELSKMTSDSESEEDGSSKPQKISMVAIKAKPMETETENEDMSEDGEPKENTVLDQMEDVAENEAPETEEEMDESSVLGRLRKRLQGA